MHVCLEAGDLVRLSEAVTFVPMNHGKPPHPSTLWRWCRQGVKARSGQRIRLDHVRVGAYVYTSRAALQEFVEELAKADCDYFDQSAIARTAAPKMRTDQQREREVECANRELAEARI